MWRYEQYQNNDVDVADVINSFFITDQYPVNEFSEQLDNVAHCQVHLFETTIHEVITTLVFES